MNSAVSWRKLVLLNRSALLSAWPRHFPNHSFADLRLIRSPLDWDEKAWAESARRYHADRRERSAYGDRHAVEMLRHVRSITVRESEFLCRVCRIEARKPRPRRNPRIPANWQEMSLDALYQHFNKTRPTPQTTVEAILHCVRKRGVAALKEPANIWRLSRCDAAARTQIKARIAKLGISTNGQVNNETC
jgi:hypothetical protein